LGTVLFIDTINAAQRDGITEFRSLEHTDLFTVVAILLSLGGVLYLDRPLIPGVELFGAVSGVSAMFLLALFGKTHFQRTLRGPG